MTKSHVRATRKSTLEARGKEYGKTKIYQLIKYHRRAASKLTKKTRVQEYRKTKWTK